MRHGWSVMACGAALLGLVVCVSDAQARPDYHKAFVAKYEKLKEKADDAKCGICHFGEKKTNRNDYGEALTKVIGKNEKDMAKIKEALGKVESEKNKDGHTFGDLIKEGKLPGTNP